MPNFSIPDWTLVGTKEELEKDLVDIKIDGEGWYPDPIVPDSAGLILDLENGQLKFYYYTDGKAARAEMGRVSNLPWKDR